MLRTDKPRTDSRRRLGCRMGRLLLATALTVTALPHAQAAETLLSRPDGTPAWMVGDLGQVTVATNQTADEYLLGLREGLETALRSRLVESFGGSGNEELELVELKVVGNHAHARFEQRFGGLEVPGSDLRARVALEAGTLDQVQGRFYPWRPEYDFEPPAPPLSAWLQGVATQLEATIEQAAEAEVVLYPDDETHLLQHAYKTLATVEGWPGPHWLYVRAADGQFLAAEPVWIPAAVPDYLDLEPVLAYRFQEVQTRNGLAMSAPREFMIACKSRIALPLAYAVLIPDCSGETPVNRVHDGISATFRYFHQVHRWTSYDDKGSLLDSTASFHDWQDGVWGPVANAFWDGWERRIYIGAGDGEDTRDFSHSFDVMAHELTHGVTQYTSKLVYNRESGAINEAMSDIFAVATEAWRNGGTITSDMWKIGEDVLISDSGAAIRYMNEPTRDGRSRDYYPERRYPGECRPDRDNDYCGVHWNSGIANLAFYLMVEGGSHPRGKTTDVVTAIGIDKAAQVFFAAQHLLTRKSEFADLRVATVQAAKELYGEPDATHVDSAWVAVGVPLP